MEYPATESNLSSSGETLSALFTLPRKVFEGGWLLQHNLWQSCGAFWMESETYSHVNIQLITDICANEWPSHRRPILSVGQCVLWTHEFQRFPNDQSSIMASFVGESF